MGGQWLGPLTELAAAFFLFGEMLNEKVVGCRMRKLVSNELADSTYQSIYSVQLTQLNDSILSNIVDVKFPNKE